MKQSLGVLAATEVRCQGEAVTGEIKARESRIPAGHQLSAARGLLSEQCLGTRGSGARSFGTCSPYTAPLGAFPFSSPSQSLTGP